MQDDRQPQSWLDRATSPDFWMIAGPVLFFLAVFVLVLLD
jgi:hypothetical protein